MYRTLLVLLVGTLLLTACEKGPGEGGTSSITGSVNVTKYDDTDLDDEVGEYPGADVSVYIIYGDEIGYGSSVKTNPDGKFEFKYLRGGSYTVYVYSEDTSLSGITTVKQTVDLGSKRDTKDIGVLEIKTS